MTSVKIPDAGGDTLTFLQIQGRLYPSFPPEAFMSMNTFKMRRDDVIVCAYPKSGTHWVWEIVRMLQAGTTEVEPAEKDDGMMELFDQDHFDQLPSPRVLNSHLLFTQLPPEVTQKKSKLIFLSRNPKDLFVSYYHHHTGLADLYNYSGKWKNYLPLVLDGRVDYGSWFDYMREWEKAIQNNPDVPVLSVMYEDIKEDPYKEVRKISDFLGKNYPSDFLHRVCDSCSFSRMREHKGQYDTSPDGLPVMYRKGQVGDWKNWFTVSMSEWFDRVYVDKMEGSKLKFRYTLED
ncbi:sulfotransferase 1C2A-like [Haliotis rubra]|uniref:sulfotransferase 1C2A-like n=1 Tax=Haliotis rubra TaxID=36100 RepID=UPI001EE50406|nr:sulfotransferase 1C2A-like [Haliotis rubra]XP_046569956.1 sulfotransferase 1C2A-like [Haliotis rubra]XP_046569957.1 sulfotransferase 1C2A-like [Haliotis rubra]XP_046569958.1 sulfotransferase 1C2A-like [Haliotis rubra]